MNPLNTYLSTIPDFISPGPVAASSPLTIPVQITLSDFRLSGFVILVFSKAKGITIVFRNDPLESLRVSSTFDSIPFIKEYLQKEIERQVRRLFQEELPVAIHKLSLHLWNPEYAESMEAEARAAADSGQNSPTEATFFDGLDAEDPFADFRPMPSSSSEDVHQSPQFSQKNLLRLATLLNSQNTLSIFTPTINDAIYRATASGPATSPSNEKLPLDPGTPMSYAASESSTESNRLSSSGMSTVGLSLGARRMANGKKRKKHRVINLRNLSTGKSSEEPQEEQEYRENTEAHDQVPVSPLRSPMRSPKSPTFGNREAIHQHTTYNTRPANSVPSQPLMRESSQAYSYPANMEKQSMMEGNVMDSFEEATRSAIMEKVLAAKLARELTYQERERVSRWNTPYEHERARSPPPAYGQ